MKTSLRLAIATGFALLGAGATAVIFHYRDFVVAYDWRDDQGFTTKEDPVLRSAALAFVAKQRPGETCVEEWIGRDDRYVYLTVGCGSFDAEGVKAGDANFRPARFRYDGGEISAFEQPMPGSGENGLRRLFPKAAWEPVRLHVNESVYRRRGSALAAGVTGAGNAAP